MALGDAGPRPAAHPAAPAKELAAHGAARDLQPGKPRHRAMGSTSDQGADPSPRPPPGTVCAAEDRGRLARGRVGRTERGPDGVCPGGGGPGPLALAHRAQPAAVAAPAALRPPHRPASGESGYSSVPHQCAGHAGVSAPSGRRRQGIRLSRSRLPEGGSDPGPTVHPAARCPGADSVCAASLWQ